MTKAKPLFTSDSRRFAGAVAELTTTNPFGEERVALEREALGDAFSPGQPFWSLDVEGGARNPNVAAIADRASHLVTEARERLAEAACAGRTPPGGELETYEDLVIYHLYHRYTDQFLSMTTTLPDSRVGFYRVFESEFRHLLDFEGLTLPTQWSPGHIFACFSQVRRAFHFIFRSLVGRSAASARLRGAAWQSIFSRDMRRFRRSLYDRMGDLTTLITGPTGTGKEVVARAIGMSLYVPFDTKSERFAGDLADAVSAVNLSALSPTLIESELFGHRKGSFTGAIEDREGWLESCGPWGTVFLDEIGELDVAIQVKLLRVLQLRTFQRLGETRPRSFQGKIIAATNRDLPHEMARGRIREDFYYRLCADVLTTPSLREQIAGNADELRHMVLYIARHVAGEEEADAVTAETEAFIRGSLGLDYPWPGNFRELEQCVRNVVVRGEYRPARHTPAPDSLATALEDGSLTADELVARYCRHLFARFGSYQEVARRTGLDWRTVKAKVMGGGDLRER
jgi:DNA-binding NtrC family response regulator